MQKDKKNIVDKFIELGLIQRYFKQPSINDIRVTTSTYYLTFKIGREEKTKYLGRYWSVSRKRQLKEAVSTFNTKKTIENLEKVCLCGKMKAPVLLKMLDKQV